MLSILIPTFNYNITTLVSTLYHQATDASIDFEIIVMEDGSTLYTDENEAIDKLEFCRYIVLKENIGRSALRNKLAEEAKKDYFLFIDCDAEICSDDFIKNYFSNCKEDCVLVGGTAYDPNENDPRFSLRLKYGRQREARTAIERRKGSSYNNFTTFNFVISKALFLTVRFDESIRGYGHEDTLFGHQLHELGCKFIQLENPLIHKGLDDNATFLSKTEEGARNLFLLYKTGRYPFLEVESKLLRTFVSVYKTGLTRLMTTLFIPLKPYLHYKLSGPSPSLRLYDLYKLLILCEASCSK